MWIYLLFLLRWESTFSWINNAIGTIYVLSRQRTHTHCAFGCEIKVYLSLNCWILCLKINDVNTFEVGTRTQNGERWRLCFDSSLNGLNCDAINRLKLKTWPSENRKWKCMLVHRFEFEFEFEYDGRHSMSFGYLNWNDGYTWGYNTRARYLFCERNKYIKTPWCCALTLVLRLNEVRAVPTFYKPKRNH